MNSRFSSTGNIAKHKTFKNAAVKLQEGITYHLTKDEIQSIERFKTNGRVLILFENKIVLCLGLAKDKNSTFGTPRRLR